HIAKGDQAADKAQQHYISAGQYLKTLKEQHKGTWAEWEELLKDKIGIRKSRASELMQIADGRKTAKEIQSETTGRSKKHRELSRVRKGENENAKAEPVEEARAPVTAQAPPLPLTDPPAETKTPEPSAPKLSVTSAPKVSVTSVPKLSVTSVPKLSVTSETSIERLRALVQYLLSRRRGSHVQAMALIKLSPLVHKLAAEHQALLAFACATIEVFDRMNQ